MGSWATVLSFDDSLSHWGNADPAARMGEECRSRRSLCANKHGKYVRSRESRVEGSGGEKNVLLIEGLLGRNGDVATDNTLGLYLTYFNLPDWPGRLDTGLRSP